MVIAPVQQMPPGNLQSRPLPSKGAIPSTASTCSPGYVWREARPNDLVCVTPGSRARVAEENRTASTRVQPGGGAYGPNTCRGGYVWREAFSGDLVCVNPEIRTLVAQENQLASSRLAALVVPQTPPGNLQSGPLRSKGALPRL